MAPSPPSSIPPSEPETSELPSWSREVTAALGPRPSRASSLVSTRTRISTTTLQEDARSIDLNVGGQYFRISRDGSKVTSVDTGEPLPTYWSSAGQPSVHRGHTPYSGHRASSEHAETLSPPQYEDAIGPSSSRLDLPATNSSHSDRSLVHLLNPVTGESSSSILEQKPDSTGILDSMNMPSRSPSYKAGEETITVAKTARRRKTAPPNLLPEPESSNEHAATSSPLRRRNGVRLPSLITSMSQDRVGDDSSSPVTALSISPRSRFTRSADVALSPRSQTTNAPSSPAYYGPAATGVFPTKAQAAQTRERLLWAKGVILNFWRTHRREEGRHVDPATRSPSVPKVSRERLASAPATGVAAEDASDNNHPPQAMDSENDISNHYTRMIRFIDREHRRVLHTRDKEMAELRERLNEKDIVYRQELRARDFLIEDLRQRLSHLEETTESQIERARHQVEDVWESRWKDRDFHLMERMRRMEADMQHTMENMIAEKIRGGD